MLAVRFIFLGNQFVRPLAHFSQPELRVDIGRRLQGWRCDFFDFPTGGGKCICGGAQGGFDFGGDLHPVGPQAQGGAAREIALVDGGRRPPGVAQVFLRHDSQAKVDVIHSAGQWSADRHKLAADVAIWARWIVSGQAAQSGTQPVDTAGIGRIPDRAADICAVADGAHAAGDGRRGPTR